MKRILFLMRYPLDDAYNLKMKFAGQMQACVNLGFDVSYIGYDADNLYLISANSGKKQKTASTHFGSLKQYRSTFGFFDLYSALETVLKNERFDYIYMRKKMVTGKAVAVLKEYKKTGGKLIVEIPSYGAEENSLGFIRNMAMRFFAGSEKCFGELVDYYTLIGSECPDFYRGKPAIEIANGVSLETIPLKKLSELKSEIHMLALASMRDWQGFDRVIRGMAGYSGEYRPVLHLVGQDFDGSVQRWLKTAEELGLSSDVIYHGALYDEKLTEMFDLCHFAIGSMAFHRKGDAVGSSLKVREYIARGIPFIYGYEDSALTGDEWFALSFAPDDSDIDFNTVVPWIKGIYNRNEFLQEIRKYAGEKLSWETQFNKVFSKIGETAGA